MKTILFSLLTFIAAFSVSAFPAIAKVLNLSGDIPYEKRLTAVRELQPHSLAVEEQERLSAFLETPPESDTALNESQLASLKNDLAGKLITANASAMIEPLTRMGEDSAMGEIWSNYCIQFYTLLYEKAAPAEHPLLDTALEKALNHRLDLRAGTALITAKNISRLPLNSKWTAPYVCEKAYGIYSAVKVLPLNRLTAFQTLGTLGDKRALAIARDVLNQNDAPVDMRLSSLAALGEHGGAGDLKILKKYSEHADMRLRTAARLNISRLMKKVMTSGKPTPLGSSSVISPK